MVKVNNSIFGSEHFGNNETIFKDVRLNDTINTITLNFESNEDITTLIFAVEYIKDEKPDSKINLIMPYIPYSGMDRKINDQVFSLKLFARIINKLNFNAILSLDVHNMEVAKQLFGSSLNFIPVGRFIQDVIDGFKPDVIHFPDEGAMKRYPEMINLKGIPYTYGIKKRDLNDKGKIVGYEVKTNGIELMGKKVLIVDDICRRGGTFVGASNALSELGAYDIGLYVSHCEEGIWQGDIFKEGSKITTVYTTDSEPAFRDTNRTRFNMYEAMGSIKVYNVIEN